MKHEKKHNVNAEGTPEWRDEMGRKRQGNAAIHRAHIERALREKKKVPDHVLKDYPELCGKGITVSDEAIAAASNILPGLEQAVVNRVLEKI